MNIVYLSDITPYHIEQLKVWLKKEGRSKATANRYLQILRGLFYKAVNWEVYKGSNPLKKVRFFRESPKIRSLSLQELRSVLKAAKDIGQEARSPLQKNFHDLCLFAINTGMRKSEILQLKWNNIQEQEVLIRGKGSVQRIIPLNAIALKIIQKNAHRNEYVFNIPNRHQQDLLRRTVNQVKKRTGIDFHFHLLRHYFTTKLIEKGVDFVTISGLLGHSKTMTSLLYSHTNGEKKKKAVDILADIAQGE